MKSDAWGLPRPELDHVFICVSADAPEASRLLALGLKEGATNVHPGQGTANRRFFFQNFYLELLWVHDEAQSKSEQVRCTRLWERWSGRSSNACPFGFCYRPGVGSLPGAPFEGWHYRPAYLPHPLCIEVGANSEVLTEPMLCYLDFAQRPDSYPTARRQPLEHPAGFKELTRAELVSAHADTASSTVRALLGRNLLRARQGKGYLLELGFDGERRGEIVDLRPELPMIVSW